MCCGILKGFGGLGAIVALILVVVALLKQLILLVGFLLTALKVAIVVVFVAVERRIGLCDLIRDDRRRQLLPVLNRLTQPTFAPVRLRSSHVAM